MLNQFDNRPIGIFDSGVGGLSVLSEIKKSLPNENFIFFADQGNVPYGGKTKEELEALTDRILTFLVSKNVKAVVIACNTATVYAIDFLREKYKMPIIGTVPVIKTIAQISKTGKTAVFSTPATAKSDYLASLIDKFASGVTVFKVGGTGLEELVEEGRLDDPQTDKILHESLEPLLKEDVDAIALGCTHYPFLRSRIEKIVGPKVSIVDSGGAVARRLKFILEHNGILGDVRSEDFYYTTGDEGKFKKVAELLLGERLNKVSKLEI